MNNYRKSNATCYYSNKYILFSGIIKGKFLLILTAILFGFGHITITYNNNR